jgi:hypothetical protein
MHANAKLDSERESALTTAAVIMPTRIMQRFAHVATLAAAINCAHSAHTKSSGITRSPLVAPGPK